MILHNPLTFNDIAISSLRSARGLIACPYLRVTPAHRSDRDVPGEDPMIRNTKGTASRREWLSATGGTLRVADHGILPWNVQIGRASCRERGSISVVAVSLKK